MQFYTKIQNQRNDIFYSKEIQREYLIKWYEKSKWYAEELGGEAKKYSLLHKLNVRSATNESIKEYINSIQYFIKNQKDFEVNDIRKYLAG